MTRAGTFRAGHAPAGVGIPVQTGAPPPRSPFAAPCYDLASRQVLQNADGSFQSIHPVDLKARLALGVLLGTISSAPTVGCDWSAPRQTSTAPKELENDVNVALASLIQNGDVKLVAVSIDQSVPGRTLRLVDYLNLRLPGSAARTLTGR